MARDLAPVGFHMDIRWLSHWFHIGTIWVSHSHGSMGYTCINVMIEKWSVVKFLINKSLAKCQNSYILTSYLTKKNQKTICDVIKQNESELANIDSKI